MANRNDPKPYPEEEEEDAENDAALHAANGAMWLENDELAKNIMDYISDKQNERLEKEKEKKKGGKR